MPTSDDYRASHLQRGDSYDDYIANVPFDAYMAEWERRHLPGIVSRLFPQRQARHLDFACGTGRITEVVAPLCATSLGVDISPSMLKVAQDKVPGARFQMADLTRDDIDIGQFDLVTSFRFFGNAQDELRESGLGGLVRRMRHGAWLIVNNHRNPRSLHALLDKVTGGNANNMDLSMGKLRRLLSRHGLTIEQKQPIGTWMYRSRMLNAFKPDDARALANEQRYSRPWLAAVSPDVIVVARKA